MRQAAVAKNSSIVEQKLEERRARCKLPFARKLCLSRGDDLGFALECNSFHGLNHIHDISMLLLEARIEASIIAEIIYHSLRASHTTDELPCRRLPIPTITEALVPCD